MIDKPTYEELEQRIKKLENVKNELRDSESRFKALHNASFGGITIHDKGIIIECNKGLSDITGYTESELIGMDGLQLIAEESREFVMSKILSGYENQYEAIGLCKNGRKYPVQLEARIIPYKGRDVRVVEFRDITDRRKSEQALLDLNARDIAMMANIGDVIGIISPDGILKYKSLNIEKWFGWLPEDLIGENAFLTVHPEDLETITEKFHTLLGKDDAIITVEFQYLCKDGTYKFIELTASNCINNSAINGVLINYHDITQKKQAEQILRNSEENLRVTLKSIGDAVIATDKNGIITRMNPVAENLTGWTENEGSGRLLPEVFHIINAQTRKAVQNPARKVLDSGEIVGLANHTILIGRDGTEYQIADSGSPIRSESGEIWGVVLVFRDITNEYKMQEQLRQRQKLDAVGQLAGGIAHDFNNVLSGIMSAAQLLSLPIRNLDEKSIKYVDMIYKASVRASSLTTKLLAFSRKGEMKPVPADIHKIINDTIEILNSTIDKKVLISFTKNAKNNEIIADYSSLENALLNLCINADHAMMNGGEIHILTENVHIDQQYCDSTSFIMKPGEYCKISVRDEGTGIPSENLEKIFEPFFTTKEQGRGTGLGLSVVYGVICDHHGSIDVYSKVGEGTTFYILLPCSQQISEQINERSPVLTGSGTILLVDDEDFNRILNKDLLESIGYRVLLAEDGKESLEVFSKSHSEIDIVLMDMIMPKMNGSEAFYKMKGIDKNCKVIIASGNTKDQNINRLIENGLAGFINKPYKISEISQLLDDVLKS